MATYIVLPSVCKDCLFLNCYALVTLDEENLNFTGATNLNRVFSECRVLTELDFGEAGPTSLTKADSLFYGCKKLERLNLRSFNTKGSTMLRHFANGCDLLSDVTLGNNFLLTATYRANFFPALTGILSSEPSLWKLPLATTQTLVTESDNAAAALLAGKVVFQNLSGNAYRYKDSSNAYVTPSDLASVDEVKALTVCEP